jgi:hypothetical protein
MHQHLQPCFLRRALLAGTALLLGACESTSTSSSTSAGAAPSAKIAQDVSATAKVVTLDKATRLLTLRSEDGRLCQVRCGPEVRNFDQIAVGDTLRVRYQAVLQATQLPAGSELRPPQAAVAAARAAKGATPAAGVEVAVSVRVRIESIDAARDIVVFAPASGDLITHRIATEAGRDFVKKLKVGDLVQLDYGEALAMAIEKVAN